MISTDRAPRRTLLGLVVLGLLFARVHVTHADIQLGASSLRTSARARVDPHATDKVDMAEAVPAPGALHIISVQATASDSAVISESVGTQGSVEVSATNAFNVILSAMRSGTDDTLDNPGGTYSAKTTFQLAFTALADGSVTVAETFDFTRPNTGTFTPYGIVLESGADRDARGPQVPFDAKTGTGAGNPEQFTLHAGRAYVLTIEIAMIGSTGNTAEEESWAGGFNVQLPPVAPSASTTTSTTITEATSTTSTTLAPLCPFNTPAACAPGLPRSITRKLQKGCLLADRASSASEHRATKLRKRSDAKFLAACRGTSKAAAKGKVSAACATAVSGALGGQCGG